MNTTTFVNSRYWDLIALTLIGITAPMVIDHYHHVLFGYVATDSKGVLEYVTVIFLFCALILVLSPVYYSLIRIILRIFGCVTIDKDIEVPMQNGAKEVILIESNESVNPQNLANSPADVQPEATSISQLREEFTRLYVSRQYADFPIYELISSVLKRCIGQKPSPTATARVFYYLFHRQILSQSLGFDRALHYFGNDLPASKASSSVFSTLWTNATALRDKLMEDKKFQTIERKIKEEMEYLGIELPTCEMAMADECATKSVNLF